MTPTSTIIVGDALEQLRELPDESVNCIVTSPPYWGLREYYAAGQMGREPTIAAYVAGMVAVFEECRRVLRQDGTFWLNVGDCYIAGPTSRMGERSQLSGGRKTQAEGAKRPEKRGTCDLATKQLCGIPWRLALALQDAGWWLRCDIIWRKPNPMPQSVHDRPSSAHEYIFLLAKSAKYWYDAEAIMEPVTGNAHRRKARTPVPTGWDTTRGAGGHGNCHRNGRRRPGVTPKSSKHGSGIRANESFHAAVTELVDRRNARSVWDIPTQGYGGEHFAAFPEEIPRRCILAGCPEGGTVLDPFVGTGTTLAVAYALGRHSIGFDINPEYAAMARKRVAEVTPGWMLLAPEPEPRPLERAPELFDPTS